MMSLGSFADAAATPVLVSIAFGSGLLPSLVAANKVAFASLLDTPPALLEPTRGSLEGSPPLASSPLLAYPAPLLVDDVVDVVGRMSASDGEGSTSTSSSNPLSRLLSSRKQQGKLVRKAEFEESIAQQPPPRNQLVGPEGDAVGQLPPQPQARLFGRSPPPAPLALAATWVALSGGAPYVSPLEVERAISRWRPDERTFSLGEYEKNLLQGRATVAAGYATLFGLQALVAVLLILQPLLGLLRGE